MSLIASCFRRLTEASNKTAELKGYKVTDVNRTRKFGIACRSLEELKRKACSKLNVTNNLAEVNVFLLDGSLIDEEYFHTLEPQSTLILQRPGEKVLSDADLLYDTLKRVNIDFLTAGDNISQFLTENLKAKVAVLYNALNVDDTKTTCSKREEHPEWFHGLETNYATKEAYMHRRCQDRIRNYLYKSIDQIESSEVYLTDRKARQHLVQAIAFFKMQLKEDHYFGHYFDRSKASCEGSRRPAAGLDEHDSPGCYEHCPCKLNRLPDELTYFRLFGARRVPGSGAEETDARTPSARPARGKKRPPRGSESPAKGQRGPGESVESGEDRLPCPIRPRERAPLLAICDRKGEFRCQGPWNASGCAYGGRHTINPYRSREELVLFSTWSLDHGIERSRSLIPQLLEISVQDTVDEADIIDCYDNLFTIKNLKLVHVLCHDKDAHK